jgi:hypothetical protein
MMNKIVCKKCGKMAVWHYVPSGKSNYCDDCVPRGCSCNWSYGINPLTNEVNSTLSIEHKDDDGRSLPCCEYDYDIEGFNVEDYDE